MTKEFEIKKGDFVVFSQGDYSDYSYMVVGRALKDFTCADIKALEGEIDAIMGWDAQSKAIALMHRKGFFEDIDVKEIHLGSYSKITPERWDRLDYYHD